MDPSWVLWGGGDVSETELCPIGKNRTEGPKVSSWLLFGAGFGVGSALTSIVVLSVGARVSRSFSDRFKLLLIEKVLLFVALTLYILAVIIGSVRNGG